MAIEITLPTDTLTFNRDELTDYDDLFNVKPSGVYALYGDDGCLYVGQSKFIPSRLRSHFAGRGNASDFYTLIKSVTVYFVNDPVERDIYETFAITHLNAVFNRAKVRTGSGRSRSKVELIEDLRYELELLHTMKNDVNTEIDAVYLTFATPKFRKLNNFTGDLSFRYMDETAYSEEIAEKESERDSQLIVLESRLREIETEIEENNGKISKLIKEIRG